jgi:uncharacterized protein YcbK (DUF882 family)
MGDLTNNFSRTEFACQCGCGFDTVDHETVTVMQLLRNDLSAHFRREVRIEITSGCRCAPHNAAIGGAPHSQHIVARACDFKVFFVDTGEQVDQDFVADRLHDMYPAKYGIGRYSNRTHFDTRTNGPARWDVRKERDNG